MDALTQREQEVGFWLAPRTIEKHVESVLRKLHVENRMAAAIALHAHFSTRTAQKPGAS